MHSSARKSHRGPNISQVISDKILELIAQQLEISASNPADIISAAQLHKDKINWAYIGNNCNIKRHLVRKHFNEVIRPRYESAGSIMDANDRSEFTAFIASLLSNRRYPSAEVLAQFNPTSGRKYSRVILRRAFHNIKKCRMLRDCYETLGYTFNDLLVPANKQGQYNFINSNSAEDGPLRLSLLTSINDKYSNTETDKSNLLQRREMPLPAGPRAVSSSSLSNTTMTRGLMNYPKFISTSLPSLSTMTSYTNRAVPEGSPQRFTVLANLSGSPTSQYNIDPSYNVMRSLPIAPVQQQHPGSVMSLHPLSPGTPALATASSLESGLEQDPECSATRKDVTPVYNEIHADTMPIFGDSGGYYSSTCSSWESNDLQGTMSSAPSPLNSYSTLPSLHAQATWTKPPIPVTPNQIIDPFHTLETHAATIYSTSASSSTSLCILDYPIRRSTSLPTSNNMTSIHEEITHSTLRHTIHEETKEGTLLSQENSGTKSELPHTMLAQQNYTELSSISSDIFLNLPRTKCNTPECIQEDKKAHSTAGIVINDPFSLNEDQTAAFV